MKKLSIAIATLLVLGAGHVFAETEKNPHKIATQKLRACKHHADQKNLSGNDRRTFIATCVKL